MRLTSKMMIASAAALCSFAAIAIATPAAQAGEYCVTNTSGMRGCGYSSMEQCQAAVSGLSGTCARDPFYGNNAMAYQPKQTDKRRALSPTKRSVE